METKAMQNKLARQLTKTKIWATTGLWILSPYDRYLIAISKRKQEPRKRPHDFFRMIGKLGGIKNKGKKPWNKGFRYELKDEHKIPLEVINLRLPELSPEEFDKRLLPE